MSQTTNFVKACNAIEQAITLGTQRGSGAHKARTAMGRDLAFWATTSNSVETYDRLTKLRKLPWSRWERELWLPGMQVACELRLMTRNGLSRAKALALVGGSAADLDKATDLVEKAGLSFHDAIAQQNPEIETTLAYNLERLHVHLEARALEDILLAAAEGYKVAPGRGYKYTEVFGLCFGSVRRKATRWHSHDLFVNVARVATQMRAKATASEVMPNSKSLAAHLEVSNRFFPHLEVVGDYHTHPYKTLSKLLQSKGWEHSDMDEQSLPSFFEEVREHHNPPLLA